MGKSVRESNWLFPTIESFHLLGLVLVIGSFMWLDFRLLGFWPKKSVSQVIHEVVPIGCVGFATSVLTGTLLWTSEAAHLYRNPAFRLKMLMLLLVGINAGTFEIVRRRRNMQEWDIEEATPLSAKIIGIVSIALWCGIVFAGRWIAYAGMG